MLCMRWAAVYMQGATAGIAAACSALEQLVSHGPLRSSLLSHASGLYFIVKAIPVPITAFGAASGPPSLPAW